MKVYDLIETTYELADVEIVSNGYTGKILYKGKASKIPNELSSCNISFIEAMNETIVIFL